MAVTPVNLQFTTPDALAAWLATQPRPAWAPVGSTYHNTYKPLPADWRGAASVRAIAAHYTALGWDTGPHLFLCIGAPNPADDGIWVMTSPATPGTHAGACNARRFGIEVVDDFHRAPMSHAQLVLLSEAAAALHDYARIGPDIIAHRDCMPGRTCPGDAAYAQKADIQARLAFAIGAERPEPRYTELSPIISTTQATALQVADRITGRKGQKYSISEIRDIVTGYYRTCTPVGVNPLLAIAQMCHETGYLSSWWCDRVPGAPGRRNPAGIGVNGDTRPADRQHPYPRELWHLDAPANLWRRGYVFANWTQATVAHVGRLVGYAVAPDARTPAQRAMVHEATATRPLPEMIHGTAPVLRLLGSAHNPTGLGWAHPGDKYGAAIAKVANEIGGL